MHFIKLYNIFMLYHFEDAHLCLDHVFLSLAFRFIYYFNSEFGAGFSFNPDLYFGKGTATLIR